MMNEATADRITETVLDHLRGGVRCSVLSERDGRVGCVTPLEYANRDNVVIWIQQNGGDFLVTDYGEAVGDAAAWGKKERRELEDVVKQACRAFGVEYVGGRLFVRGSLAELGELIWRVGSTAAQASQAAGMLGPRAAKPQETAFAQEVKRSLKRTLAERSIALEVDHELRGQSGHQHRATIFIPTTESVIEPVTGNWNQVNATYTKFGDLEHANGFHLYSLLDDTRAGEDVADLLAQVSDVVEWSRRDEWLATVG